MKIGNMTAIDWLEMQYHKKGYALSSNDFQEAKEIEQYYVSSFGKKVADHWGMTDVPEESIKKYYNECTKIEEETEEYPELEGTVSVCEDIIQRRQDQPLDEFHYHEVLDRLMIINDMMENYLMDHPVCETHKELKDTIEKAQDILGEAYLFTGDIIHKK